ncbi:MAG: class I SAM-dependent methyltransferase [Kastovskya adunca ATA6-11-RM4]|jgi:predicted O-methyltransferase YrrM|nr:class I SAM-dependent methyltransferase [Kastovskya adunca ATA6-11-RM4]
MYDAVLSPVNALLWLNKYKGIKSELANLVLDIKTDYSYNERLVHATDGSLKFSDAYVLKSLLYQYKPARILEVGSFLGFSTRWLLEVSSQWGAEVTAVDPNVRHRIFDDPQSILKKLNQNFYPENLEIVQGFFGNYGDCTYFDYENYEPKLSKSDIDKLMKERKIIDENWGRKFDFVFIDGDHEYKAVMENFAIALNLLSDGGCIAFHDVLTWKGVNDALQELSLKYQSKAEVKIYGKLDKQVLERVFNKSNDGIGSFRLL